MWIRTFGPVCCFVKPDCSDPGRRKLLLFLAKPLWTRFSAVRFRRKSANSGPVSANYAQNETENGSCQTVWRPPVNSNWRQALCNEVLRSTRFAPSPQLFPYQTVRFSRRSLDLFFPNGPHWIDSRGVVCRATSRREQNHGHKNRHC